MALKITVQLDTSGWFEIDRNSGIKWESVTSDEMTLKVKAIGSFPSLSEVSAVRHYFRDRSREQQGAIVSCDVIELFGRAVAKSVLKYYTNSGLSYTASIHAPIGTRLAEIAIRGSEYKIRGIREALVTQELIGTATDEQRKQLASNFFPMEWKFERYEPGTRGSWAYQLSDDEKYDQRFPDHPLSRVRRWLRRIEKTFQVTSVESSMPSSLGQPKNPNTFLAKLQDKFTSRENANAYRLISPAEQFFVEVRQPAAQPMQPEEVVRELGMAVLQDEMFMMIRKQAGTTGEAPLAERQERHRESADSNLRHAIEELQKTGRIRSSANASSLKTMESSQYEATIQNVMKDDANKQLTQNVIQALPKLMQNANAATAHYWVAQNRGSQRFSTIPIDKGEALILFTSEAMATDFVEARKLDCKVLSISVRDLFVSMKILQSQGVTAIIANLRPKCSSASATYLSGFPTEEALLQNHVLDIEIRKALVQKYFQSALQQIDPLQRLGLLRHITEHLDPCVPEVYIEMAKIALNLKDMGLFEESRRAVEKYAPQHVNSLARIASAGR